MGRRATYLGVFGVALSTLVLEILLTRITSVVAWYHLAFFVISLAMLGMTAGAVLVFLRPSWFADERIGARLVQGSVLLAMSTPPAMGVALAVPLHPIVTASAFASTFGYAVALAVPFTVGGVVLTLALTRAGLPPGRVYGIDLCGAAAGCVVVIPLLDVVDAPSGTLVASALAALSAHAFARAVPGDESRRWRRGTLLLAGVLIAAAALNATGSTRLLYPRWIKGLDEHPGLYAYEGWNTYSRVTVDHSVEAPPVLWAPSRTLPPELAAPIEQRAIRIDGAAATMMARLDTRPDDGQPGSLDDHAYLAWDITSFAHRLRPDGAAAVIGVGGGRDVLEAVRVGHTPVVGIELNDLIVRLHHRPAAEGGMREFSGLADLPGVELVVDEARSFMTRDPRRYAVITMSLIDTWAATGAGAYALSENGLYTVEGWRIFLGRLEEHGIFTVSRWYKPDSPGETARMLALAMETLWSLGAPNPRAHLVLLQNHSIATLLVSRRPLTPTDVDRVQEEAVAKGFTMMLTPRRLPSNPVLRELAAIEDRAQMWRWASAQLLDMTPPTDERPFFFNMLRPATWLEKPTPVESLDLAFLGNLHATQTLVYATGVSAILTFLTVIVPLGARRRALSGYRTVDLLAACGYFALIGLGFMFVEMGLLSRLNVFLGHPTLALAVLLGGVIFFTGLGSLASARVPVERRLVARTYPLLPAALVGIAAALVPVVLAGLAGAGTPIRVLVGIAMVGLPALGMGLGFPLGLRLVGGLRREGAADLGPWMWGINGACGVVASGLALGCSMVWGISTTLGVGAVCYLLLPLATARLQASGGTNLG